MSGSAHLASLRPAIGDGDPAELARWRAELRDWLDANVPRDWRAQMAGADDAAYLAFQRSWLDRLREGGYLAPGWPKEWGGGGYGLAEQVALAEELARAGAPQLHVHGIALHHAASTLLAFGSDAQRERHLPAILNGEIWCQGFSEPEAGSDLASLRTRARRDGDRWIVDGQKIWSSYAHYADWCLLLARTDPDAPKRKGITCFALDLRTSGVEVVPIRQSTGASEFCEIFLTEVAIPAENVIGPVNEGWRVAQGTLSTERSVFVLEQVERLCVTRDRLARDLRARLAELGDAATAGALRHELAQVHIDSEVLRLLCYRMLDALAHGGGGGEASVIKVMFAETLKRLDELGTRVAGLDGQRLAPLVRGADWESGDWMIDFLSFPAWTVGGGSSEVMRNVLAERVLGLPREGDPR